MRVYVEDASDLRRAIGEFERDGLSAESSRFDAVAEAAVDGRVGVGHGAMKVGDR